MLEMLNPLKIKEFQKLARQVLSIRHNNNNKQTPQ